MQIIKTFNEFDTPWEFKEYSNIDDKCKIEYKNVFEINQGAPQVGNLLINGKVINENIFFTSPFIYYKKYIYIPLFVRKFCISGFRLVKINILTNEVVFLSKIKNLIFLDSIKGNTMYYYTNFEKTQLETLIIDDYVKK